MITPRLSREHTRMLRFSQVSFRAKRGLWPARASSPDSSVAPLLRNDNERHADTRWIVVAVVGLLTCGTAIAQQEQSRLGGQGAGQIQPSLFAKSEFSGRCLGFVRDAYQLEQLLG